MNPKKKSRRCRGLGLDSGLDLAISRFIHSPGPNKWFALNCSVYLPLQTHLFKKKKFKPQK
jgi:hypothetical protein